MSSFVKLHFFGITSTQMLSLGGNNEKIFCRLQHLWTGPISNASVDVAQGGCSVEVRASGVTKGAAMDRILGEIIRHNDVKSPVDFVLCICHILPSEGEF